jgi:histidinol-phosphate aminotransferase
LSGRPVPRPGIGNIRGHMIATGEDQSPDGIFIASNESVYGPGEMAREAIVRSANTVERYPDDGTLRLADAIGARFSIDPARICCGFGSDDLLARLARAYLSPGDELIHSAHGYPKIPNYAYANDAVPVSAGDRDFTADVDSILKCLTDRTRIVMLANPDNPAGTYLNGAEVRRLHENLSPNILLVLDSAYTEYVQAADYEDPLGLIQSADNVVMTRTFSKVFGLAGLRVGWACGPEEVMDSLKRIGITFPISVTALAACEAGLEDRSHFEMVIRENRRIRGMFSEALLEFGLKVIPSQTNFVLVRFPDPQRATDAHAALEAERIYARRLAGGDFAECVRFTMGTEEEMRRCVEVTKEWLKRNV